MTAQHQPVAHRPWILVACMLAMFMAAIEVTIVATAMPTIIAQLGGFAQFGWVFSGYLLTQAVSVPIYGRLADLWGRKRIFFIGTSLFLLGSVLWSGPEHDMVDCVSCFSGTGRGRNASNLNYRCRYLFTTRAGRYSGLAFQRMGRGGDYRPTDRCLDCATF